MMEHYDLMLMVIFAILVVLGIALLWRFLAKRREPRPVYEEGPPLVSAAERSLVDALDQALGGDYRVLCKVRLADLVQVRRGVGKGRRQEAEGRIEGTALDFVICHRDDLGVAGVVELDDLSRPAAGRRARGALVETALRQAGIPLVRVPRQGAYAVAELRGQLARALQPAGGKATGQAPGATDDEWQLGRVNLPETGDEGEWLPELERKSVKPVAVPDQAPPAAPQPAAEARPRCPSCGSEMVRRRVTQGKNAGTVFWGCAGFPECRTVVPIEKSQIENL